MNPHWEIAEFEYHRRDWAQAWRYIVAHRRTEEIDPQPTLFILERYAYRAGAHESAAGIDRSLAIFYDGRAGVEPRIGELCEEFALRKYFATEVVRLAYNLVLVSAFQWTCLTEEWQSLTLSKLRSRLFWLPAELIRPGNRPTLQFANPPLIQKQANEILRRVNRLKSVEN